MTNKHSELIRDYLLQYFEGFALIGFDTDGEFVALSGFETSLHQHAIRKAMEDAVNSDTIDMLLPSTASAEIDFEWIDDDDEDGEWDEWE